MKDAVKYCKILYTFGNNDGDKKIFETNEPIMKLMNELTDKIKGNNLSIQNSTRIAQIYLTQRLIHVKKNNNFLLYLIIIFFCFKDKILDIHLISHGKSYFITDIEWFCQTINNIFHIDAHIHRKTEYVFEQLKHTVGTNIHMIFKNDLKKLKINGDEVYYHI